MNSPTPLPRWLGVSLLLLIAASFASNHVAARLAFDHGANVATAVAVRSMGAALFVLVLLGQAGVPLRMPASTLRRALGIGLLVAIQSLCLYSAVARIPVALALLAFNTFPLMLGLISWAAGGEQPSRRTFVAMPIALAGLAVALDVAGLARPPAGAATLAPASMGVGVAFALGGAASFASALYLTTRWLGSTDGRLRTLVLMLVVTTVAIGAGALRGRFDWPADSIGWAALAALTVLYASAITALFVLLPRLGAVNNAAVMNFEPIAALFLGWVVLDQQVAAIQIAGALVVIGAIVMLTTGRR
ncbi:MAG: DMT family transporter [Burkholderiaceae bacterium]|nr:DMT family transporter [Burkholderiaceae bacterium]MEB2351589.1 DMT family transporter [Burkholderiaceae bacterium]